MTAARSPEDPAPDGAGSSPMAMDDQALDDVSRLLDRMRDGHETAWHGLYALLYQDLRQHARWQMRRDPGVTYSPTALVHETWLRLRHDTVRARNRGELVGLIVQAMRCALVDGLRRRLSEKRGGGVEKMELADSEDLAWEESAETLVALDGALTELERLHPRLARVVEWRYFGGYTEQDIAGMLGVTERTVRRDWQAARLFLLDKLGDAHDMQDARAGLA